MKKNGILEVKCRKCLEKMDCLIVLSIVDVINKMRILIVYFVSVEVIVDFDKGSFCGVVGWEFKWSRFMRVWERRI